jgi:hypothetical protein
VILALVISPSSHTFLLEGLNAMAKPLDTHSDKELNGYAVIWDGPSDRMIFVQSQGYARIGGFELCYGAGEGTRPS